MDEMFKIVWQNSQIRRETFLKLKDYIYAEEYDTESIELDVSNDDTGNISSHVFGGKIPKALMSFVRGNEGKLIQFTHQTQFKLTSIHTVRSAAFSVGYTFYYWKAYRNMKHFPHKTSHNVHYHSGYFISDLYVNQKYQSFKDEISHYDHFDMNMYSETTTKVDIYLASKKVKALKPKSETRSWLAQDWINLSYEIAEDEPISFNHLLSLCLYTDYTNLSSDFSSTFRALHRYETLSSVKRRNANYHFMSKYLREAVQIYGRWNRDERDGEKSKDVWKGPWCMSFFFLYML